MSLMFSLTKSPGGWLKSKMSGRDPSGSGVAPRGDRWQCSKGGEEKAVWPLYNSFAMAADTNLRLSRADLFFGVVVH